MYTRTEGHITIWHMDIARQCQAIQESLLYISRTGHRPIIDSRWCNYPPLWNAGITTKCNLQQHPIFFYVDSGASGFRTDNHPAFCIKTKLKGVILEQPIIHFAIYFHMSRLNFLAIECIIVAFGFEYIKDVNFVADDLKYMQYLINEA